jgi:DNA-binding CsgD family transcriptional regulator
METLSRSYGLFFDFIDKYLPGGFQEIDPDSSLMLDLERMMETNNQFFFIGDQINVKFFFASKRSLDFIGVEPKDINPMSFLHSIHPDDLTRLSLIRTKIYALGSELYLAGKGIAIISTTLRFQDSSGNYTNQLVQCLLFYKDLPYSTVFRLQVHTSISGFRKTMHGYHYYIGDDLSYFRYPDERLLLMGDIFSDREFEIIKMVSEGLNSKEIATRLFLSVHTVDTHRRNILKKTNKSSMYELILDLKKMGLL